MSKASLVPPIIEAPEPATKSAHATCMGTFSLFRCGRKLVANGPDAHGAKRLDRVRDLTAIKQHALGRRVRLLAKGRGVRQNGTFPVLGQRLGKRVPAVNSVEVRHVKAATRWTTVLRIGVAAPEMVLRWYANVCAKPAAATTARCVSAAMACFAALSRKTSSLPGKYDFRPPSPASINHFVASFQLVTFLFVVVIFRFPSARLLADVLLFASVVAPLGRRVAVGLLSPFGEFGGLLRLELREGEDDSKGSALVGEVEAARVPELEDVFCARLGSGGDAGTAVDFTPKRQPARWSFVSLARVPNPS